MALEGSGGGSGSARGIRAGAAYVELNGKDNTESFFAKMKTKFAGAVKAIGSVMTTAFLGGATLLAGGLAVISGPLLDTIQDLGKMQDVADAFGITGKAASGLFGVLEAAGGEFKENIEGIVQFSGTIEKAFQGVGQGKELFDGLAVRAKDLKGLAIDEQFYRVLGAIRQLPQPLQQAKLAMLGGSDSLKQWEKLLSMSEAEVRALADKLAFTNAELRQAADASKAYQAATLSVTRAWRQIAVAVAPVVKEIAQWVEKTADGFTAWFKGRSAANILEEVWVRIKQGLYEVQALSEDVFGALWDYFADNAGPAIEVVKKLFSGLFQFAAGAFAKIFPIWTKYLVAAVPAMMGTLASMMKMFGMTKEGDALFAKAKEIDPTREADALKERMKEGDKDLAEALKGFDEQRKIFDAILLAQRGNLDVAAAVGGPLGALAAGREGDRVGRREALRRELEGVQKEAAAQQFVARWADTLTNLYRPDLGGRDGDLMAGLTRALGTFGAGSFLTQGYGVQSAEDVGKKLDKGNKLQAEGNEHLAEIKKKVGKPKFG